MATKINKILSTTALTILPFVVGAQIDTLPINNREILGKENIDTTTHHTEKLVISAGRSTKSVDQLPVTVYIISHEEIIRNGYFTLCDVLKTAPGIRVSQPHSGELGEAFIQRGMTGNTYTKILLNGVDIKPSAPTGMPLGANVPIRQAERIEIIYGPASASYGNDACGGVINIVTKQDAQKNYAQADAIAGTGGYHYINFHAGGKFGRGKHVAQYAIYGSNLRYDNMNVTDYEKDDIYNRWNYFEQRGQQFTWKDAEGEHAINPTEITPEIYQNYAAMMQFAQIREIVGYTANYQGDLYYPEFAKISQEAAQTGIELLYRGINFSYNYMYRSDFSTLGMSPMLFNYSDPNYMMGEKITRAALSGTWTFGNFSTNTVAKYIRYRMDENSARGVTYSPYTQYMYAAGDDIGLEENITYKIGENIDLSAGVSYQFTGILPYTNESRYKFDFSKYHSFATSVDYADPLFGTFGIYPYTYSQTGAYGQAVWDWKIFSLTGGIRYDYNSKWGNSLNPRIAGLVKISDRLTFRASRGYAYKAPTAQHLYSTTAVDASVTLNTIYKILGYPTVDTTLIAYHQVPAYDLNPEKIASTELGLRFYINHTNYMELVVYTNRIRDPIVRTWCDLDTSEYQGIGSSVVSSGLITRSYRNENNSQIKLRSYQFIAVFKDLYKPIHLNIDGAITMSLGHEDISNDDYTGISYDRVNYIRQTPKYMAQLAFDFNFLKIMHFRAENVYCSKWARKYYLGNNNKFFWATQYYNLDVALTMKIGRHLIGIIKVTNVFDQEYGGIDMKEMDVDLQYNPQLKRNVRFGLTYEF